MKKEKKKEWPINRLENKQQKNILISFQIPDKNPTRSARSASLNRRKIG
jgi:hypothetical protein